ncbi:sensor histidine kinase [Actinotalea solisilvae]|uniref:sensor histidine kinase n=1 Tax=Actinotalea solisilvae TaxID=2072922 RepID=UPI0027DAEA9D|nr:ATP-binding protein [Actinotalea solisilvae]
MSTHGWSNPTHGLAARLLGALALVVLAGGLTAWLVAGAVGPAVFHDHMIEAGLHEETPAVLHAEEAFRSSSALALTIALSASVLASLAVSLVLTRRISLSLRTLATAATRVAAGHFDSRVATPRLGDEFEQLAQAFNDMADRLRESDALRRRLLSDVAHEVRTPVAVLNAYLEAVEDGVESLSPETLAVLRDQGSRLTRLATDLASVTRAEGGDLVLVLQPASAAEIVERARAAAQEQCAARGVTLDVEVEPDLPPVTVDLDRIGQVLANLLENALRHTPPHGEVVISATRAEEHTVRLAVTDTGEGIEAAHLEHVFERFYRVDTARDRYHGGSGIGLAIVRAIVTAHGGHVRASSRGPGTGARFEVDLPALEPRTAERPRRQEPRTS